MASPVVIRSNLAKQDLKSVYNYLASEASPEIADMVMAQLVEAMCRAAAHPLLFRERPDYHPSAPRRIGVNRYAILYEPLAGGEGIFVLRILHGNQDIPRYLR